MEWKRGATLWLVGAWAVFGGQAVVGCSADGAARGEVDAGQDEPNDAAMPGEDGGKLADSCAGKQLAAGRGHACVLKGDGTVWCWGSGSQGQLGLGPDVTFSLRPIQLVGLGAVITAIGSGPDQTCALKSDGTLWCWGTDYKVPVQEVGLSDVASFAVGAEHVCAIDTAGSVSCRGDANMGQLGIGSTVGAGGEVVGLGAGVVSLAAGDYHACALKQDGTVWCWGKDDNGQLGLGDDAAPFQCGGVDCQPSPVQVAALGSDVKSISAARDMTCAIKKDGSSWCWGTGILGDGVSAKKDVPVQLTALANDVTRLAPGSHGCAVRGDGSLWCWGSNGSGELGLGNKLGQGGSPGVATMPLPLAIDAAGSQVTDVVVLAQSTCVLQKSGIVACWGANANGQLGDGTNATPKLEPVAALLCESSGSTGIPITRDDDAGAGTCSVEELLLGDRHSCARKGDGSVWCWGDNKSGALGAVTQSGTQVTPVEVRRIGPAFASAGAAAEYGCGLESNGSAWCWGKGTLARSSAEAPEPAQVGFLGYDVAQLFVGQNNACAIKTDGTLWCSGKNNDGELGVGSLTATGPTQVTALGTSVAEVAIGESHLCALKKDGTVWCWGSDHLCQMGRGATMAPYCGGFHCEMLPVQVAALGDGNAHIEAGFNHTCVIRKDGALWCWGSNIRGQLGVGLAAEYGGANRCGGPAEVTTLGKDVKSSALGESHTCAVKTDGSLYCWGSSSAQQLGTATTAQSACIGFPCDTLPVAVTSLGTTAIDLEAGRDHTCARTSIGVMCWGVNESGQVGNGNTATPQATPTLVGGLCP